MENESHLDKTPRGRQFPVRRAAEALNMADFSPIDDVAEKMGVSVRTIHRWRARLHDDVELQLSYQSFVDQRLEQICREIPVAILSAVNWIERASKAQDVSDPNALKAMGEITQTLTQLLLVMAARRSQVEEKLFPPALE